jgi:hypothetical protein
MHDLRKIVGLLVLASALCWAFKPVESSQLSAFTKQTKQIMEACRAIHGSKQEHDACRAQAGDICAQRHL